MRASTAIAADSELLSKVVGLLLEVDDKVCSIVLIGSFAWFPDLARDIDIVVITESDLPTDAYWEAVADFPKPVDVIVLRRGEKAKGLVLALRTGVLLWGDEGAIEEATENMPVPTLKDAQDWLELARDALREGFAETDPDRQDKRFRNAFNLLFEAARVAAMWFLDTEEGRWGELRRQLPNPFSEQFRQFINTLHIAYWYDGDYPQERVEEEFDRWHREVSAFIEGLRQLKGA
jgi:predicted nucleotidyltransferase